jgi:hypothetical protein
MRRIHTFRTNEMEKKLCRPWKLFMAYFDLADLAGHLYFIKKPQKLKHAYYALDNLTFILKRKVKCVFLIISDHGMKPFTDGVTGNHSFYALWSLNFKINWQPRSITDFHMKILEWNKNL